MAGLNPFEFKPGQSLIHILDPRCKFFLICLLSIGFVSAGWAACLAGAALMLVGLRQIRINLPDLVRQLKFFLFFLGMIVLARGFTTPGTPLVSVFGLSVTGEGLFQGALVALRFFLVMVLGLTFSATTRPADMKAAVQWFLAPVPFIPEKRVGIMISLALRFFPLIFSQAGETRQAIRARCGSRQKNPVKRITTMALALLTKSVQSADGLAMAMEARCYTDTRTDPELRPCGRELYAVAAVCGVFLVLIFL
ncbi:MAG: energy-coupling factor transporter transmembrane protein EcfT [Desulfobacterales bacterium]|nr:energy-coupling factor transporter transmembrane protein EcfT [Desulfobacterales bacterium]